LEFTVLTVTQAVSVNFRLKDSAVVFTDRSEASFALGGACSLQLLPPYSANALLASLSSLQGSLTPGFNPNIFDYHMNVPSDISKIEFDVKTSDAAATYHVNRQTLFSAGTSTAFTITVTAQNKKDKSVYTVSVNRAAKASLESSSSNGGSKGDKAVGTVGEPRKSGEGSLEKDGQSSSKEIVLEGSATSESSYAKAPVVFEDSLFLPFLIGLAVWLIAFFIILAVIFMKRKNAKQ
jgi:hypothetical protein